VQDARNHAAIIDTRIAKPAPRQTQLDQRSNVIQGQNTGSRARFSCRQIQSEHQSAHVRQQVV
jgi:hypothetical protein